MRMRDNINNNQDSKKEEGKTQQAFLKWNEMTLFCKLFVDDSKIYGEPTKVLSADSNPNSIQTKKFVHPDGGIQVSSIS